MLALSGFRPRPVWRPGGRPAKQVGAGQGLPLQPQVDTTAATTSAGPVSLAAPRVPATRVHFAAPQVPSARSLAAPGQLPAAALVQGLGQQQLPPLLLREDVVAPAMVLCRTEVLLTESTDSRLRKITRLPRGADSGPARARKPHTSLAAIVT